jgi:glycolate oxidase subunit GlcD
MGLSGAGLKELERILSPRGVVNTRAGRLAYESDGLALIHEQPEIVLLPRNTDECARAMRVLAQENLPLVGRGAGTGLSGGATPVAGGAVIGTSRMRDVLELNVADRFARVQAGVVNVDLTAMCAKHGLFYAPDPSSQQACTIGGNVGENSGGPHCFKYGATVRHVLGLVIVLADGEVLDLSAPQLEPQGYDLAGMFVGSEGTFGVATEVTVCLTKKPAAIETLLAIFPSLDGACDATSDLIAARLEPSAIEILDKLTIEAVEASVFRAGYPKSAEAVLLVEAEGSEVEVATTVREVSAIARARGAIELRNARSDGERKQLWAGRKGAFGAMGRIAPDLYVADVCVPRTRLKELVLATTRIAKEKRLKLSNVFHAGDGNLHPNISYDRRDPGEVERVLAAGREIMALCVAAGGSLTGEHGVGLEKREEMCLVFRDEDLRAMTLVREAWDPARRLNPGKLLPIRGCREARSFARHP